MRWATRRDVHVDRAACPWLIRRFVDPDAEFLFVGDAEEVPVDATPFDMRGVELSHHGGECSFEAFLRRYELDDPGSPRSPGSCTRPTWRRALDAPEAAGLDALVRGLSLVRGDAEVLGSPAPLFDGLLELHRGDPGCAA